MNNTQRTREILEELASYERKTDYYEILGVPKNAGEEQIKTAYKRLVKRIHPDRNQNRSQNILDRCRQVFIKLSKANETLMDPDKRAAYDRYGPQENRQDQQQQQFQRAWEQFMKSEQIFRQAFERVARQNAKARSHVNEREQRRQQQYNFKPPQQAQKPQPKINIANANKQAFTVVYIAFFCIVVYFISAWMMKKPKFMLSPSDHHRFQVHSEVMKIPYYVTEEYYRASANDAALRKKTHKEAEYEYVVKLNKTCEQAKILNQKYRQAAKNYGPGQTKTAYIMKARQVVKESCQILDQLKNKHKSHIGSMISDL